MCPKSEVEVAGEAHIAVGEVGVAGGDPQIKRQGLTADAGVTRESASAAVHPKAPLGRQQPLQRGQVRHLHGRDVEDEPGRCACGCLGADLFRQVDHERQIAAAEERLRRFGVGPVHEGIHRREADGHVAGVVGLIPQLDGAIAVKAQSAEACAEGVGRGRRGRVPAQVAAGQVQPAPHAAAAGQFQVLRRAVIEVQEVQACQRQVHPRVDGQRLQ